MLFLYDWISSFLKRIFFVLFMSVFLEIFFCHQSFEFFFLRLRFIFFEGLFGPFFFNFSLFLYDIFYFILLLWFIPSFLDFQNSTNFVKIFINKYFTKSFLVAIMNIWNFFFLVSEIQLSILFHAVPKLEWLVVRKLEFKN